MSLAHLRRALLAVAAAGALAVGLAGTASSASTVRPAASMPPMPNTHALFQLHSGIHPDAASLPPGALVSTNWAGYAADNAHFRAISAEVTVPSVECTTTPDAFSYHWVGIDGLDNGTVEQDGVASFCVSGSPVYFAWYALYPQATEVAFTVNPGDAVQVATTQAGSDWTFDIKDVTTGQSFVTTQPCGGSACNRISAEVISEGYPDPPEYAGTADYGAAGFQAISITNGRGKTGNFGSTNWTNQKITQEESSTVIAGPGPLYGGAAFENFWHAEAG